MEILLLSQIDEKVSDFIIKLKELKELKESLPHDSEDFTVNSIYPTSPSLNLNDEISKRIYKKFKNDKNIPFSLINQHFSFNLFLSEIFEKVSWENDMDLEEFLRVTESYEDIQSLTFIISIDNIDLKLMIFKKLLFNLISKQFITKIKISNLLNVINNIIQEVQDAILKGDDKLIRQIDKTIQ